MLRVAIVGCGVMGPRHAMAIAEDPRSELVVVHDLVGERARTLAERHRCAANAEVDVDAVVIATPAAAHLEAARPWLRPGVGLLVEKPLMTTELEALPLDLPCVRVAQSERFQPALGSFSVDRDLSMVRLVPADDRTRGVDLLSDLMVHDLDLLHWKARRVDLVDARQEGERWVATLLADGNRVVVTAGRGGSERTITGDNLKIDLITGSLNGSRVPGRRPLQAQWSAFCDWRLSQTPGSLATPQQALSTLRVLDRIRACSTSSS